MAMDVHGQNYAPFCLCFEQSTSEPERNEQPMDSYIYDKALILFGLEWMQKGGKDSLTQNMGSHLHRRRGEKA
uniref:Uncharacterized protein n=1 Tax=Panagrellus redivivus TaxID=6233 RepID=A0A7E4ZSL4_PANRE